MPQLTNSKRVSANELREFDLELPSLSVVAACSEEKILERLIHTAKR